MYFSVRVILAIGSVYVHFLMINDPSTWAVTIFLVYYSILTTLGFDNSFRLVSRNLSHSDSGLRGAARLCALRFKNCWLHGLLPLASEGTPRDNSASCKESFFRLYLLQYFLMSPYTNGQFRPYIGNSDKICEKGVKILFHWKIKFLSIVRELYLRQPPLYWTYFRKGTVSQFIR